LLGGVLGALIPVEVVVETGNTVDAIRKSPLR
jgi:hypothetical protein